MTATNYEALDKDFETALTIIYLVKCQMEKLKEENARLREALAVYADPEYWRATKGDDQEYLFIESIGQKTYVQGKVARAALKGKE